MKSVLTVIGTRPEAIKLAPVLKEMGKKKILSSKVCITGQHTDLLDPFLIDLGITTSYQLENCPNGGDLHQKGAYILKQMGFILAESKPDLVLVQGDTTSAFSAALAAFYSQIPVAHIEAGLRTGNLYSPWPEEAHRCLIDQLTTYFFAPTLQAQEILLAEGASPEKIWVVGNTSIDAIRLARISSRSDCKGRAILVTIHRRENHGKPLEDICAALRVIAEQFSDVRILFFLHPNPAIRIPVSQRLSGIINIHLMDPVDHTSFIRFIDDSVFIITDSGGIQEEAPYMGKPVLIARDTTERPEGIRAGTAHLVGTKSADIVAFCRELLGNPEKMAAMSKVHFPYGDGYAAERIVSILEDELKEAIS